MSNFVLASRRGFLGGIFSAGALILAGEMTPAFVSLAEAEPSAEWKPNVFVGMNPDGSVIIVAHRSEMGTGIRTSLPMVVADELGADWSRVTVRQAAADEKAYGSQNTDGSCSIRDFYDTMRQAGATARIMLERAAASKWNVSATECRAENHEVLHAGSGQKIGFADLVELASHQPVPAAAEIQLKPASEFRYIGKGVPSVDLKDITVGKAIYGFDAQRPGMVYASIERPPVLGGKLRSFDDTEAKKVPGVLETTTIPEAKPPYAFQALGGVAVIAENTWAASQGRKKLKVEWESGPNAIYESGAYKQQLIATATSPQRVVRTTGDVEAGLKSASKVVEATYYTPLLSHAPMEPPAAVAEYKDGKVEIWAATQNPAGVQSTVALALAIKPEDVTCHVTLLGGAFGRKSKPDYVAEASILSKKLGKPVKISWTREEDVRFDYYHAPSAMYFKPVWPPTASHRPGFSVRSTRPSVRSSMPRKNTAPVNCRSAFWTSRSMSPTYRPKTVLRRHMSASAGCVQWPTFTTPSAYRASSTNVRTPPDKIRWNTGWPRSVRLAFWT